MDKQFDFFDDVHDDNCQLNYPHAPCICDCSITTHSPQEIKDFEEYCYENETIWGPSE